MNNIEIFKNAEFGEVRTLTIDGEPYFVGKDVAEILGYGFSANGDHISSPNVEGPSKSLRMAIERAGVKIDEIGYINAHATSTHVGDTNEAKAIYNVFGDRRIEVTLNSLRTNLSGAGSPVVRMRTSLPCSRSTAAKR